MLKKTLQFLILILLFVAAMTAGRLYFFLKYLSVFSGLGAGTVAASFLQGLRFDLSTASIVALPLLLLLFLPGVTRSSACVRGILWAILIWYLFLIGYNFIDIQYYAFTQRHLTFEINNTWRDTDVIMKIALRKYLLEFAGFALFSFVFAVAFKRLTRGLLELSEEKPRGLMWVVKDLVALFIVFAVSFVLIRGGFQTKPLSIKNAFANEKTELGVLSLNGVYTTFNTLYNAKDDKNLASRLKSLKPKNEIDFPGIIAPKDREENTPGYPLFRRFKHKEADRRRLNVVVFVMESWSAKFMRSLGGGADASPFFDTLSRDGLLLTNCFANAQRSYEGLSASLGSLPVWKGMALDQGGLLYQTRLEPVGQVLKGYGYDTIFVHGARRGSMGFDGLVRRLGIQRHITRDDFTDRGGTDDGVWGIYDEYAFLRAHEEFEKADRPFFAVVYSLTSHTPYRVPSKEFEHFGPGVENREFLNAMRYSDYALKKFFEKARGSKYFKDTLFVIVADHTEGMSTGASLYENYRIPCLFYAPGAVAPGRYAGAVSQIDVVPTMFDILKMPAHYTSWGKSVFSKGERKALLPRGDLFVWVSEPYMLVTDLETPAGLYDYTKDPSMNLLKKERPSGPSAEALQEELLQYLKFSYSLILDNKIRPGNNH